MYRNHLQNCNKIYNVYNSNQNQESVLKIYEQFHK